MGQSVEIANNSQSNIISHIVKICPVSLWKEDITQNEIRKIEMVQMRVTTTRTNPVQICKYKISKIWEHTNSDKMPEPLLSLVNKKAGS